MTQDTPARQDWFLAGFLAGALASVVKTLINEGLSSLGLPLPKYDTLASAAILGKRGKLAGPLFRRTRKGTDQALGYLTDALFGGLLGAGLACVQAKTPPGHDFAKGAIGGAGVWAVTMGLGKQLRLAGLSEADSAEMLTLLSTCALYGGLQGVLVGKLRAHFAAPPPLAPASPATLLEGQPAGQAGDQPPQPLPSGLGWAGELEPAPLA